MDLLVKKVPLQKIILFQAHTEPQYQIRLRENVWKLDTHQQLDKSVAWRN